MKALALTIALAGIIAVAPAQSLRSQMEASNKTIHKAMLKNDFGTLLKEFRSGCADNFVYEEAGQKMGFDQMWNQMKASLSTMKLTVADTKIISVKESGKTGTSVSKHTMAGTTMGPDKKKHTMSFSGESTDSYMKVGSKWKMTKMSWGKQTMMMDGKPMDPSKMDGGGK